MGSAAEGVLASNGTFCRHGALFRKSERVQSHGNSRLSEWGRSQSVGRTGASIQIVCDGTLVPLGE